MALPRNDGTWHQVKLRAIRHPLKFFYFFFILYLEFKILLYVCYMDMTKNMKNKKGQFRKLTIDEVQRSIKASNVVTHLWMYSNGDTYQRTHNNSIFLTRTIGEPIACIVVKYDSCMYDNDFKKHFGNDVFIDGGVSPADKEGVVFQYDCFYYTGA